jgi:hypothetical protein
VFPWCVFLANLWLFFIVGIVLVEPVCTNPNFAQQVISELGLCGTVVWCGFNLNKNMTNPIFKEVLIRNNENG